MSRENKSTVIYDNWMRTLRERVAREKMLMQTNNGIVIEHARSIEVICTPFPLPNALYDFIASNPNCKIKITASIAQTFERTE